jgi:hypothetical protein
MKKMIIVAVIGIFLLSGMQVVAQNSQVKNQNNPHQEMRAFAHTVFSEFGSTTSCSHCPYVHMALKKCETLLKICHPPGDQEVAGVAEQVVRSLLGAAGDLAPRYDNPPIGERLLLVEAVRGGVPSRRQELGLHVDPAGVGFGTHGPSAESFPLTKAPTL